MKNTDKTSESDYFHDECKVSNFFIFNFGCNSTVILFLVFATQQMKCQKKITYFLNFLT